MSLRSRSRASTATTGSPIPATKEEQEQHELWRKVIALVNDSNENGHAKVKKVLQSISQTTDQLSPILQESASLSEKELRLKISQMENIDEISTKFARLQELYETEISFREHETATLQNALEAMTSLISSVQSVSEASTPVFTGSSTTGSSLAGTSFKKRRRGPEDAGGKTTFTKRGKLSGSQSYSSSSSLNSSFTNNDTSSNNSQFKIGSQVAFRLRKHKGGEEEWIQCEVTKVITEGVRFEVQDPEPDENNNPGQSYKAGIKDILPIPIDQENSSLPTFPPRTVVLARYPETTTFYRAEVIVDNSKKDGKCRLKFEGEEEEGKETEVDRRLVLPIR